jgi:hypothetical protein
MLRYTWMPWMRHRCCAMPDRAEVYALPAVTQQMGAEVRLLESIPPDQ